MLENASRFFPPSDPQDVFQDHSERLKLYTVQGPQHGSEAHFPSKGTLQACLSARELSAALPMHSGATVLTQALSLHGPNLITKTKWQMDRQSRER